MDQLPYGYCGIMCALCNRHIVKGTSGCAGCSYNGYYSEPCKIAKCCREKGLAHCALCPQYPCEKVKKVGDFSDLHTDGHYEKVCRRIRYSGFDSWYREYEERKELLTFALEQYNNGGMKKYLCELFMREELPALRSIMDQAGMMCGTKKEMVEGFRHLADGAWKEQEEPCERVLSHLDIRAYLGITFRPEEHLSGKVLLTRYPEQKARGLFSVKQVFHLNVSMIQWLKEALPCVIADRTSRIEAMEQINRTCCPECLRFVCDPQVAEGKGYFSYEEVCLRYRDAGGCVKRDGFKNNTACVLTDETSVAGRATAECSIRFTDTQVYRDNESRMWMVLFFTEHAFGGCQEVYMDGDGITRLIVYGE